MEMATISLIIASRSPSHLRATWTTMGFSKATLQRTTPGSCTYDLERDGKKVTEA